MQAHESERASCGSLVRANEADLPRTWNHTMTGSLEDGVAHEGVHTLRYKQSYECVSA